MHATQKGVAEVVWISDEKIIKEGFQKFSIFTHPFKAKFS